MSYCMCFVPGTNHYDTKGDVLYTHLSRFVIPGRGLWSFRLLRCTGSDRMLRRVPRFCMESSYQSHQRKKHNRVHVSFHSKYSINIVYHIVQLIVFVTSSTPLGPVRKVQPSAHLIEPFSRGDECGLLWSAFRWNIWQNCVVFFTTCLPFRASPTIWRSSTGTSSGLLWLLSRRSLEFGW